MDLRHVKDCSGKKETSMNFASIYGDSDNENKLLYNIEKDVVVVLVARIVFQFYLGSELINLFNDESVQPP